MSQNQHLSRSLLIMAFLQGTARGADVLPVGTLDTTATGKVSSTRLLKPGELKASTQIDGSSYIVGLGQFASEGSGLKSLGDEKLASSANRFSIFTGYGLTDWMDFHIGVRSSSEKMNSDVRRKFYLDGSIEGNLSSSGGGFSGAVASTKFHLLSWKDLKVAGLAFYESGVGDVAWNSVTRSERDKLGLAILSSYSFPSFGQILANVGYRSRKAEEVGQLYLGNETFFKVSGNYHITPRIGTFLTIDSRQIRVADEKNPNRDGWLQYKNTSELAMELGVTGYVYGNYRMTGFIGGSAQKKAAAGSPERTFGLSLIVPILSPGSKGDSLVLSESNSDVSSGKSSGESKNLGRDSKLSSSEAANSAGKSSGKETDSMVSQGADKDVAKDVVANGKPGKPDGSSSSEKQDSATNAAAKVDQKSSNQVTKSSTESKTDQSSAKEKKPVYPEMQVTGKAVDGGIPKEGEFVNTPSDAARNNAVDPFVAMEDELKQIAADEAKAAEVKQQVEKENKKLAVKQWAINQKKKASLDRTIQKEVDRKTKDYIVTDKDVEYKGLD